MMPRTRAILLDALGTLVELEPPWVHLAVELGDGAPPDRLKAAVRAEMRYYRAHSDEGRDADSLADLRQRCADVLSRELGRTVDVETLMAAIRFRAFPDAPPALARLRERSGLGGALDAVVTSAAAGARKPDPSIFVRALELAGTTAGEAVHVGDTAAEDVEGARAAGIRALLLERNGRAGRDEQAMITSLDEIDDHLAL
jgi:putative hydrolase of the HAD superfamily